MARGCTSSGTLNALVYILLRERHFLSVYLRGFLRPKETNRQYEGSRSFFFIIGSVARNTKNGETFAGNKMERS